jgi:hydroxymethylglutaryl-CoA synthase
MTDIGITSYGVYVPRYRMNRKTITGAMGWLSSAALPGEKAIANFDEDSLSMAVSAGFNCLRGGDPAAAEGLYFASTTCPYREGESASIIAAALDLPPTLRTADFSNSLKAGTSAILSACDSVKAGSMRGVLVCAADCRVGKPSSALEMMFGDGAAAVHVGKENVIARIEGSYSLSYDFPDYRRDVSDAFVRGVEERFIREEGYGKIIPEAVTGLLKTAKLEPKDFAKVAYPCLNVREYGAVGKKLGFQPNQIQQPLLNVIGETGTASPLLLLAAMLDEAKPGDKILLASYGNGSEALFFTVTQEIEKAKGKGGITQYLESKKELASYEKYLIFRDVFPVETGFGDDVAPTEFPLTWRERKTVMALYGSRCKRCGTAVFPAQRICVKPECVARDEMEECRFSDKKATLFSYTIDQVAFSLNPPLIFGFVDFEGGGRAVMEFTDCEPESLAMGMPVEMSFRKKYHDKPRGIHGYFWKATPIRAKGSD